MVAMLCGLASGAGIYPQNGRSVGLQRGTRVCTVVREVFSGDT